jgi:adenylate cyclase
MAEARVERRLAAILAADVAGYSRLMGVDEEGTLTALKAVRSSLFDPKIAEHRGRIVKTTGDGALVEFASAVDAIRCAMEIQHAMAERNAAIPEDRRVEFRIGINVGDIISDESDIYGDGVNIAARVESLASPGAISLSENAYQQIKGKLALDVSDMGERQLKNIAQPVRIYGVRLNDTTARPSLALPDKPSIAVLPFANMSGDPEQEYFADGVVEDIITGLSRIKWLFVIARNSSFSYKGKSVDLRQVGRELGVRYVLEGSVRKAGNRVRVTAQLIDASNGHHVWAERYDRALDDIFAVQDEITISVVGAIEPSLRKAEIERVKRKRPDSLDAYDLTLRALPLAYNMMPEDATEAIPLLQKAVTLDPEYATAHALLAWCYHFRFSRGGLHEEDRLAAVQHARAAQNFGGDDATALALAGLILFFDAHDSTAALKLFDQAFALSSSNIFALVCSAIAFGYLGRTELAIDRAQRALRLSPFDSMKYMAYGALSLAHFHAGRYQEACEAAQHAVESNPRFSILNAYLAAALIRMGRCEEAKVAAQRVLALQPTFTVRGLGVTVGHAPEMFSPFADALREAGLPES